MKKSVIAHLRRIGAVVTIALVLGTMLPVAGVAALDTPQLSSGSQAQKVN